MPKPKYRLTNAVLDEVSLVPSGDDGRADIVLAKSAPEGQSSTNESRRAMVPRNRTGGNGMSKKADDEDIIDIDLSKLDPEVRAYIEALENEVLSKDDDDDDDDDTDVDDLDDSDESDDDTTDEADDDTDSDSDEDEDEEPVKKSRPTNRNKGGRKVSKSRRQTDDDLEAVLSKADPAVASLIRKMQRDNEDLREAVEDATEIAKQEREQRERREWISKAERDFPNVGAKAEDLGGLLHSLSEKAPAEARAVEKLLRAASNQIGKSALFGELGRPGAQSTTATAVDGMAAELRKANPDMTYEQAVSKVYEENPDLYLEELNEQQARR